MCDRVDRGIFCDILYVESLDFSIKFYKGEKMISYLKCPNCKSIISADDSQKVVQCLNCGKKYLNPNFKAPVPVKAEVVNNDVAMCKKCGRPVSEEFEFCPYCGASTKRKCVACGNDLRDGDVFCSKCGKPVNEVADYDAEKTEKRGYNAENAHCSSNKKAAPKQGKHDRKAVLSVVKSAICLALCIMLFAFAFCPVATLDVTEGIEYSGVDFIGFMGATAKNYDRDDDAKKLENMQDDIDEIGEDIKKLDYKYSVNEIGKVTYYGKFNTLLRKRFAQELKYELSIKGNVSPLDKTRAVLAGIVSLSYILAASGMIITSMVALAFAILRLRKKDDRKYKFWNKYHYLLAIFIFLSLALLLCVMSSSSALSVLSTVMICRLLFECFALAFVIVDICTDVVSESNTRALFKVVPIVVCLVVVGLCFAPCFVSKKQDTDMYMSGEKEVTVDIDAKAKSTYLLFGACAIGKNEYDESYKDLEHVKAVEYIQNAVKRTPTLYYIGYGIDQTELIVKYVFLDKYAYDDSQMPTSGYYMLFVAIMLAGAYSCLSLFSAKGSVIARRILWGIVIALLLGSVICSGVICTRVNEYMRNNEIKDFKLTLGGGLICSMLFAIGALVCDFLQSKVCAESKREEFASLAE